MSKFNRERVERLLSQDEGVESFQFEEFRMNLEKSINELERKEQFYSKAAKYCLIAYVLLIVPFVLASQMANETEYGMYILRAVMITANLLLFASMVFASVHWTRYRPALRKAKEDLQLSVMADLQWQVAELSRKLGEKNDD